MLEDILADKDLVGRFHCAWKPGDTVFNEGDASQDLFILTAGVLDVFKGQQKVAEINQPGSVFGEMSFLLGQHRTATLKSQTEVEAICIPRERIGDLLGRFPQAAEEIARLLARRLDMSTQVVHSLKEFCDQLPDAVVLCDPQGKVLAFNAAASRVYGQEGDRMQGRPAESLFDPAPAFRDLAKEALSRSGEVVKTLVANHPVKGSRQVQVSISPLRDSQHELVGLVFIGRDVTSSESFRRRYRRLVRWALPLTLVLALVAAAAYWDVPPFDRDLSHFSAQQQLVRDEVGRDCLLLQSLLSRQGVQAGSDQLALVLRQFLIQNNPSGLYRGVLLLDASNRVVAGAALDPQQFPLPPMGSAYASLSLSDNQPGAYRLLELYRPAPGQPSGVKSMELLFTLPDGANGWKWLVLALERRVLQDVYKVGDDQIARFRFGRP